jgi:protein disulfide-isomerase-like protein
MYINVVDPQKAKEFSGLLKTGNWVVLFHATWCGHCVNMKPEWQNVVSKLKNSRDINVADVVSDQMPNLNFDPKVEGFPTIKMFNNGPKNSVDFNGERVATQIINFAQKNSNNNNNNNNGNSRNIAVNNDMKKVVNNAIGKVIASGMHAMNSKKRKYNNSGNNNGSNGNKRNGNKRNGNKTKKNKKHRSHKRNNGNNVGNNN